MWPPENYQEQAELDDQPVSLHLGLSPARQVGQREACTTLCLEFSVLNVISGN